MFKDSQFDCNTAIKTIQDAHISHISQMSISLRNIDKENKVHERSHRPKLSGEILGDTVVSVLKDMSLHLDYCIGIAADGCAVMTSCCVNAVQSPCSNHALNLSISKSIIKKEGSALRSEPRLSVMKLIFHFSVPLDAVVQMDK
ncbi:Uncharacterized protein FWK35_00029903 [Aphis craccivora]|uniref:Uncharacterized protein n=1 Tax=Aphis craccivora TaxID=307492 RepID=A0A6G0VMT4_APHCR|nr:Uncharacterized protein FWK35_00029903 [Aphis craccivora]